MTRFFAISIFLWVFTQGHAATSEKYWVFLKDKQGVTFDPHEYFHPKAIERRVRNNVPLIDSTDFPLNHAYVTQIDNLVDSVKTELRWLNAMVVYGSSEQLAAVSELYFVKHIAQARLYTATPLAAEKENKMDILSSDDQALLELQTKRMGGDVFAEKQIDGKGVRVAIFDTGFPDADTHSAFDHIRNDNRIIKTFDFVRNKENVYHGNSHGLSTFSCVGGKYGDINIGLATGAEFLLARTERAFNEPFSEEENWMKAAEWADQNGADIISSSLGYTSERYFYEDMNGSSYIAKTAKKAFEKGILVVNSMGNEGTNDWKFVITPADVPEVLSIGGTDPSSGYHTSFSSYGPTYDYQLKPNVTALGHVMAASTDGGLKQTQGTSFSCPLVAGFAACVLQLHPEYTVQELFTRMEESGDLHPYFDYAHGYGVPQATGLFYAARPSRTFTVENKDDYLSIEVQSAYVSMANQLLEDEQHKGYQKYLYYHIENSEGYISDYYVIIPDKTPLIISKLKFPDARKVRIHFYGFTEEIEL